MYFEGILSSSSITVKSNKNLFKIELFNELINENIIFYFSSLLIVYEGYQINDFTNRSRSPLTTLGLEEESNESSSFIENLAQDSDGYLDGSQSNASNDYHLGNDEVSQSALHRAFGEAAARGAKNTTGFYPINEETVFMDPPSDLLNATVVPSQAYDNWIGSTFNGTSNNSNSSNHSSINNNNTNKNTNISDVSDVSDVSDSSSSSSNSSGSGDEYCCVGQHTITNSDDISSDLDIGGKCTLKRTRPRHRLGLYDTEDHKEDLKCSTKRLRVKNDTEIDSQDDALVDVRMIDFAHTTFGHNITPNPLLPCHSNSTVHQGPDCGFLTGLDSLKRLLLEILAEG